MSTPDEDFLISSQVDDYDQERRFRWHVDLGRSAKELAATKETTDCSFNHANHSKMRSKFGNHQVNYSATKYIKP
jgi:hypothetical protein